MKLEIKKLFELRPGRYLPCGLNILEKLWWRFMPGVIFTVKWPRGLVIIDESMPQWDWTIGPSEYKIDSADPNDHYRPWLERNVGRQGWDWNWGMADNNVAEDRLTIKIRRKYAKYSTTMMLLWG